MNTNKLTHFDFGQLPGGQFTPDLTSELVHLHRVGRTWTTHGPWRDTTAVIAGRIAQLAQVDALSFGRGGMVLTAGSEESEFTAARLQNFLPGLLIRNLTADARLHPGNSKPSRAAVFEDADVRVITYRLYREVRQSFGTVPASVTFLDQAELLLNEVPNRQAAEKLTGSSRSVHLFTTTGLMDHPVSTFHLASLLWLPDLPRDLPRFKAAYVHSTGYGSHEVMRWHPTHVEEVRGALDQHHHQREEAPRPPVVRPLVPASVGPTPAMRQLASWG